MDIRKAEERDISEIIALVNELQSGSHEFMPVTSDRLLVEMQEGRSIVLIAEEGGRLEGVIMEFSHRWGNSIGWLTVRQRHDRPLLEDMLVQELEKAVNVDEITTRVDADSPEIGDWFRRGYTIEGGLYNMTITLDSPRQPFPVPEKAVLRTMRAGEEQEVVDLVNRSFGWERLDLEAFRSWKERDQTFSGECIHVAQMDGRLVSVIVARLGRGPPGEEGGHLESLATLPEYRNRGLGRALMVKAMNFLFERGMRTIWFYTWETNPAIRMYEQLGFKIVKHWKFLNKTLHGERSRANGS